MLLKEPTLRAWNKAEYHQAADLGWFDGQRVELINGEVVDMPPQKEPHAMAIMLAERALREAFGAGYVVRSQLPLNASDSSEPEPDIAVVRGRIRDMQHHPGTALLIIEIADSTLEYDRERKSCLYAACKVADYWIVNLRDRQLEVHRKVVRSSRNDFGHDYAVINIHQPGEAVAPLARTRARIKVADLLP